MKTTLNLNDKLLAEAKAKAARERTTLTRLIEEGLKARLRVKPGGKGSAKLPVYQGKGGLAEGLDGLNNAALRAAAVLRQSDHLISFDAGFNRWLPRSRFTHLKPSP